METSMEARDFYIRATNKDGNSSVSRHRVWDADKFLRSSQDQYAKEKDGAPWTVTVSNEAEFKQQGKK